MFAKMARTFGVQLPCRASVAGDNARAYPRRQHKSLFNRIAKATVLKACYHNTNYEVCTCRLRCCRIPDLCCHHPSTSTTLALWRKSKKRRASASSTRDSSALHAKSWSARGSFEMSGTFSVSLIFLSSLANELKRKCVSVSFRKEQYNILNNM